MKRASRSIVIGLTTTMLAVSSASSIALAYTRDRHGGHGHAHPSAGDRTSVGDAGADVARRGGQAKGLFAGAGGIYSPDYEVPGGDVYHLGGQLLGGEFGKAYEDYYRHYYYYKYAYCPIGTGYVISLRRCVGPGSLLE